MNTSTMPATDRIIMWTNINYGKTLLLRKINVYRNKILMKATITMCDAKKSYF